MSPDNLTPAGVVEEFQRQFTKHLTLPGVMPLPGLVPHSDRIELTSIAVHTSHQGNGYANLALQMLTQLCDANCVTLELTARPLSDDIVPGCSASMSSEELVHWYGKHGFVTVRPNDGACDMIREWR